MATQTQAIIRVVDGQIVAGDEFRLALTDIQTRAAGLVVKDRDSCENAKRVVKSGNDQIAMIIAAAEPDRLRLQNALDTLRSQRDQFVAQFAQVINPLDRDARNWSIKEQEDAKREQEKLNKGKRAADRVEVIPDVPKVAGTAFRVRYRFKIIDIKKIAREFLYPNKDKSGQYRESDFPAIGALARTDMNPAKTEKTVGGIKVWKE